MKKYKTLVAITALAVVVIMSALIVAPLFAKYPPQSRGPVTLYFESVQQTGTYPAWIPDEPWYYDNSDQKAHPRVFTLVPAGFKIHLHSNMKPAVVEIDLTKASVGGVYVLRIDGKEYEVVRIK